MPQWLSTHRRIVAAGILALSAAGLGIYRSWPRPTVATDGVTTTSQVTFGDLPIFPAKDWAGRTLMDVLLRAPRAGAQPANASPVDEMLQEVAELLVRRVANNDPKAYIQWRLERGYRFADIGRRERKNLELDWPVYFGTSFPENTPPAQELLTRLWRPVLDYGAGMNDPVGILGDQRGMVLAFQRKTSIEDERARLDGFGGWQAWHGRSTGALRNWFVPPISESELIARDGFVETAAVGVMMVYRDGSRRPVSFEFIHAPESRRWYLINAKTHGFLPGTPLSAMEL